MSDPSPTAAAAAKARRIEERGSSFDGQFDWSHKMRRADGWRCMLLRLFGAPISDDVMLGDRVIVYSLATITIGDRTIVSQGAHLRAGDHDMDRPGWVLRRIPISIGSDAWIAADAFVGPGVDVGDGAVLGARVAAFRVFPDWTVCVGTSARPHRARQRPMEVR